jgi:hypothetical protein
LKPSIPAYNLSINSSRTHTLKPSFPADNLSMNSSSIHILNPSISAYNLLLNILELSPPSSPIFVPHFSLVLSITVGVKFLGHASIVFFFLSISRP